MTALHHLQIQKIFLIVVATAGIVTAYRSGVPPVNRRALAGLWKLTPSISSIKEFTVHPIKPPKKQDEVLLMLKEDGSFTRFENDEEEEAEDDVDKSWTQYVSDKRKKKGGDPTKTLFQGTWDYRNGELILAADRDEQKARSDNAQGTVKGGKQRHLFWKKGKDTILVGAVVACQNDALAQLNAPHGEMPKNATNAATPLAQNKNPKAPNPPDLSVPMGSVQVGKFFYPKNHPSFFDQPIFQPKRFGTFQLKQVLRELNVEPEEDQLIEKFRNKDFHNKLFFLTSSPIKARRPKGNVRWSIKYNKYVEDSPSKEAKAQADAEENQPVPIRVMKVMIHANNTFSTLAGLGDTAILRGRFNVFGDQRDQVWMQSLRFGFGRSVSGSTYSEGNALGEESKSYWGTISYEEDEEDEDSANPQDPSLSSDDQSPDTDEKPKRLHVKGSVIVGWGLEPQPVGRFIMREAKDDSEFFDDYDDEDEDEEEEEEEEEVVAEDDEPLLNDDWSNDSNAFQ